MPFSTCFSLRVGRSLTESVVNLVVNAPLKPLYFQATAGQVGNLRADCRPIDAPASTSRLHTSKPEGAGFHGAGIRTCPGRWTFACRHSENHQLANALACGSGEARRIQMSASQLYPVQSARPEVEPVSVAPKLISAFR